MADAFDRDVVNVAVRRGPDHGDLFLDVHRRVLWLFEDFGQTLASGQLPLRGRVESEPNCAKAASSRYCAISSRRVPAICFIALICALPPTRLTEFPVLIAGRMPR